jgi:hypothetical protein
MSGDQAQDDVEVEVLPDEQQTSEDDQPQDDAEESNGDGGSNWLFAIPLVVCIFALVAMVWALSTRQPTEIVEIPVTVQVDNEVTREIVVTRIVEVTREAEVKIEAEPLVTPAPISITIGSSHEKRLRDLDPIFRSQGIEAWLKAAGFTWEYLEPEARQIEEETMADGTIVASGIQVQVTNLSAPWPNCFTTDQEVVPGPNTRVHQPDLRNPSKLWTDVPSYSGPATLWIDVQNWGQLNPITVAAAPEPVEPSEEPQKSSSTECWSLKELATLGEIIQELEHPPGTLAGAQIKFTQAWAAPEGWIIQKQGSEVNSVVAGDTASVWSAENCRPLNR